MIIKFKHQIMKVSLQNYDSKFQGVEWKEVPLNFYYGTIYKMTKDNMELILEKEQVLNIENGDHNESLLSKEDEWKKERLKKMR